ncbi:hypothetical protein HRI_002753400 [Hibiscus trionum]|uniref:Uncharacterized protein n=1 Tax=Hibiscus trionum TaxID=183268 RepID=A0A9W7I8K7_HIBTR|nr:hypothetical protein HRI_002753400 [Hibiscus trionum]
MKGKKDQRKSKVKLFCGVACSIYLSRETDKTGSRSANPKIHANFQIFRVPISVLKFSNQINPNSVVKCLEN